MTANLTKYSSPRHLLNRILEQPGLVTLIQRLDAKVLGALVNHIGLEDSGEIVALATTDQIKKVFDLDLWRSEKPGKEEKFDTDRFAVWLEIMLEMGTAFAAEKIAELDEDFLTMALSRHVLVVNIDELISKMYSSRNVEDDLLDKALESGLYHEFDEYRVVSTNHRSWDAVFTILVELDGNHHDLFTRIMGRCYDISAEYIEDNGGLYDVLTADEQIQNDVAYEREQRREKEGYVLPATGASFLSLIRVSKLEDLVAATGYDTVTQSYFKTFAEEGAEESIELSQNAYASVRGFVQLLKDAGVISALQGTLLLQDARGAPSRKYPLITTALLEIRDFDGRIHAKRMTELNYLANVLISGCSYADRVFRPGEAAEAALATCNLGLEYHLSRCQDFERVLARVLSENDVIKLFRIGGSILFTDVSLHSAKTLAAFLSNLAVVDPWEKEQVEDAMKALNKNVEKGTPWKARGKLDLLEIVLDQPTVSAIKQVIDECPTVPAAEAEKREFVSSRSQIAEIHSFIRGLKMSD